MESFEYFTTTPDVLPTAHCSVLAVGPKIDRSYFGDKYLHYGKIAIITCGLEEGDLPLSFTWIKDDKLATSLPEVKVVNHDFHSVLTILATSSVHAGIYVCKVSNPVSWALMKFEIFVNGTFDANLYSDAISRR